MENPSQFFIQVIGSCNQKLDPLVQDMTEYYKYRENRETHILENVSISNIFYILLYLNWILLHAIIVIIDSCWKNGCS